jgi:1,2-phenylacetyl-CoA epoxidase catalytic subunit
MAPNQKLVPRILKEKEQHSQHKLNTFCYFSVPTKTQKSEANQCNFNQLARIPRLEMSNMG